MSEEDFLILFGDPAGLIVSNVNLHELNFLRGYFVFIASNQYTYTMIIIYSVLGIIAFMLILGLFVSRDMNYEKSVSIDAGIGDVWKHVSSLTAMDKWSPWKQKDPDIIQTITGTDGTVGATQSWESKVKNVGEGSQTIVRVEEPHTFDTKLVFLKPFKSIAEGYVKLVEEGSGTRATWGFKSQMPYPMNLMKLFMNFEKGMDKDFGQGLGRLKQLCEMS